MDRQRAWAIAFLGFTLGVFAGGCIVFIVLDTGVHQITDAADQSIATLKASNYSWEKAARDCSAQFSTATLLVEDPRFIRGNLRSENPVVFFLESLNPQSPSSASVEGWYIPAKVTPTAYGNGPRRYWWFDPKEKKLDGPYIPMRNTVVQ